MKSPTRSLRRRPNRRNAPGFSLFELLMVLGVLVVIVSISLPFTWRMLHERELASTEENIAAELLKARAHAQESGKPVEVFLTDGAPARLSMRYFEISKRDRREWSRKSDRPTGAATASTQRGEARDRRASNSTAAEERASTQWHSESELISSVRVASAASGGERRTAAEADTTATDSDFRGTEPVRLVVFLPDGSALFTAPLHLRHDCGLESRMTIDPWTGHAAVERGVDTGSKTSATIETTTDAPESDDDLPMEPESTDGDALDEFEVNESGRG